MELRIVDETKFLEQWLARIRTAFRVDFSFATLQIQARRIEAAAPADISESPLVSAFVNTFFEEFRTSKAPTVVHDVNVRWGFRSLVVASLSPAEKSPVGVAAICDTSRCTFTAPECFEFQQVTEELGAALMRAEAPKTFDQRKILLELAEEIDFLASNNLLSDVTERVASCLGADFCTLRLTDNRGCLRPVALGPNSESDFRRVQSTHHAELTPLVFQRKRSVTIPNLPKKQASAPAPWAYLGTRLLSRRGKLIGLLEVFSLGPRTFSTQEVAFLEEIAELTSRAILKHRIS